MDTRGRLRRSFSRLAHWLSGLVMDIAVELRDSWQGRYGPRT